MGLGEKYWYAVLFTFLRYLAVLLLLSGIPFILAGHYYNSWFYIGLFLWPLGIMLGVVNLKYIHLISRDKNI